MNADTAKELVLGLFTEPRETMHKALLPENEDTTKVLAGVGFGVGILGGLAGGIGGMIAAIAALVIYVGSVFMAGKIAGGQGEPLGIGLLCGLVYLPVGIVSTVTSAIGLGFIGSLFGAVASYFIVVVGHGLEDFKVVLLVWVVATIIQIGAAFVVIPPLAMMMG